MVYFVAALSAFFVFSAATALRPSRHGLFAALAYPVGWAAGELAGQGLVAEGVLVFILWAWGWPHATALSVLVVVLASLVVVENLVLVAIQFISRRVVRLAMEHSPDQPLRIGRPRDDRFGTWWRTALQIPVHPHDMQLQRNIAYGPLDRHRLDVWRLSTTPSDAPVIFYLHGGAWTFGDKREQGRPMLHEFVRRGWIVVASNYRLAPRFPWPAQIQDATRALGWIKRNIENYGGDPDRVVVAGGSAGGHLAALLALTSHDDTWRPEGSEKVRDWSVRGALSFYGVLEMTGDERHWHGLGRGIRFLLERRVVQQPYEGNEQLYAELSPLARIRADAPPFFVVQGTTDTLVDVNVARDFVATFREVAFAPIYYVELPLTQHAFDVTASPRTSATTRAAVAFAESVAMARPTISPALRASYQVPPNELWVAVDPGCSVPALEATRALGSFVVVTSDNPYSRLLSDEENTNRRVSLHEFLRRRGIAYYEVTSHDPSGRWPDETCVALPGVSSDDGRALARSWNQFAIYDVCPSGIVVRAVDSDEVLV
jgi:acetyl esterase/lipase